MPPGDESNLQDASRRFFEGLFALMQPSVDKPGLSAFLEFRDEVRRLAVEPGFLRVLDARWRKLDKGPRQALLLEVKGWLRAAKANSPTKRRPSWLRRFGNWLLGKGEVVTGSMKDILKDLPAWAKNTLTLVGEAAGIFRSEK